MSELASLPAIRVVVIDSQPFVRWAWRALLENESGMHFAGEASTPAEGLQLLATGRPDVAIVGLRFDVGTGFGLIREALVQNKHERLIVFTTQQSQAYAHHCLRQGARGYICKSEPVESFVPAIHRVMAGGCYLRASEQSDLMSRVFHNRSQGDSISIESLSPGELEVFHLIGQGFANRDISSRLSRSIKTIETYRARIKSKLGMRTAIELTQFAFEQAGNS